MSDVVVTKPVLTNRQKLEKRLRNITFPACVHIKEKHGDAIYLVDCIEDLITVCRKIIKNRLKYNYYGQPSHYFSGTYDEYLKKNLGLTLGEIKELMEKFPDSNEIKEIERKAVEYKRWWYDEHDALGVLNAIAKLDSIPELAPFILWDRSGHQYEGFEVRNFDNEN